MHFFIPHTRKTEHETVYNGITDIVKDQLKVQITPRKIFSINYIKDKKEVSAEVGKLEHHGRYVILAIFEANPFVIFTQTTSGDRGITLLVGKETVTAITEFD